MKETFLNFKILRLTMHRTLYWPNNTRELRIVWSDLIYKRMEEEALKSIEEDLERYEILIGTERENVFPCERLIPFERLKDEDIIKERERCGSGLFINLNFDHLLRYLIKEMGEKEKAIVSHSHIYQTSVPAEDDCIKSLERMCVGLTFKYDKFHKRLFATGYKGKELIVVYYNDEKISPIFEFK
jgi:hypothetical protein